MILNKSQSKVRGSFVFTSREYLVCGPVISLSRARSGAAMEETGLLLEASVSEFGETQWD